MTQEAKTLLGIGLASLIILIGGVFLVSITSPKSSGGDSQKADEKLLVRDNSHKIGTSSASVTVVEFGDFQCPACGASHPIVKQILNDYKDKITFVYRHFPLPVHKNAKPAAEAAEAAGAQAKFWEMFDLLFENQTKWAESDNPEDLFLKYAKELKLDMNKFKSDIQKNAFEDRIRQDQSDGNKLNINSTPTFFINRKMYAGTLSYNEFKSKIEQELRK